MCVRIDKIKDAALLRKNLVQLKFLKGTRQSLLLDHLLSAITLMTLMLDQNFATTLFAVPPRQRYSEKLGLL